MTHWHRLLLTLAVTLLVPASGPAQEAAASSDAAHLFAYYPKEGMREQFDAGYRRHLAWHREKQDPLVWYAWYVVHGERSGLFIDGTFGRPFTAFDERVDPAGDREDGSKNVTAFADPAFLATYVLRPELGTGQPLEDEQPSASIQVFHYRLRAGTEPRFERAVRAAREALERSPEAPAHTWYELVVGGEQPSYMLMVARDGWADYDRFRRRLSDLIADGREPDEAERLLDDLATSAESVLSETWSYREDRSYFPQR